MKSGGTYLAMVRFLHSLVQSLHHSISSSQFGKEKLQMLVWNTERKKKSDYSTARAWISWCCPHWWVNASGQYWPGWNPFAPVGPIDKKSALVQLMTRHWKGDKPLPQTMMNQFNDAPSGLHVFIFPNFCYHLWLTAWPPTDVEVILDVYFSNSF